ncbi:MAG: hypothetical protein JXR91_11015 [Deltaproteobacteria bacterium]|nr:hypothetical protein [Deltaproteobacteria bacterium]
MKMLFKLKMKKELFTLVLFIGVMLVSASLLADEPAKPKTPAKVEKTAKAEAKPEAKTEAKPEAKTEAKPEAKTEAKPEAKTEAKPEAKTEAKPEEAPVEKAAVKSDVTAKPETSEESDAAGDPEVAETGEDGVSEAESESESAEEPEAVLEPKESVESDESTEELKDKSEEDNNTAANSDAATVNITEATDDSKKMSMDGENFIDDDVPMTDRIVNVPTAETVRKGALVLTVDHRAHKTFISGEDAWFDYLGLDSGNLKIGLGLRYGITDFVDAGFYRLSNGTDLFDVYEFDTKLKLLRQKYQFVNLSFKIGFTWFVQKNAKDASGVYGQLILDRRLFKSLLIGTGFAFHTDSSNDKKILADDDPSAAVLGYIEWRPIKKFSLNAEMAANVAGYGSKYPVFAFSARMLTYRHTFSLVVSNSQYMSSDGIVSNSWRGFKHLVFGFQITREFNLLD